MSTLELKSNTEELLVLLAVSPPSGRGWRKNGLFFVTGVDFSTLKVTKVQLHDAQMSMKSDTNGKLQAVVLGFEITRAGVVL